MHVHVFYGLAFAILLFMHSGFALRSPLGYWLAFERGGGTAGLWWGVVGGLFLVAIGLIWIVRLRVGEQRGRLSID